MYIPKRLTSVFLLLTLSLASFTQVNFRKLNLEDAMATARSENKQIFIDFRADWCKPCVEMEKYTFTDKEVGDAINEKYIPIKADVDFFEWMDVKEDYNVSVMPTLLIINSQGAVQQRIIGKKTPESLMAELGLPYYGNNGEIVDVDPSDQNTSTKKECFLKRWWRKLTE